MEQITLTTIIHWATYWIAFWTVVNLLLPPRETFKDFPGFLKFYNVMLLLVAYYGSLNVRQFTVQLYGKLGVPLEGPSTEAQKAAAQAFVQGVDTTGKAATEAVKEAVQEVKQETPKTNGG